MKGGEKKCVDSANPVVVLCVAVVVVLVMHAVAVLLDAVVNPTPRNCIAVVNVSDSGCD